jgi:hypothetical protein
MYSAFGNNTVNFFLLSAILTRKTMQILGSRRTTKSHLKSKSKEGGGEVGGKVTQTMYTHVSKYKNDKTKIKKQIKDQKKSTLGLIPTTLSIVTFPSNLVTCSSNSV